ncbi:hypothetical protein [Sinorhizobium fredii]|uniref:hypothetical protein n=1 Tax=Rhizobium fredii TaxID=380 RepID=UPI0035127F05
MPVAYCVGPIKDNQVDRSYCLVEAVGYNVGLDDWRQFCAAACARRYLSPNVEDVITVENQFGYVTGVSIIRTGHSDTYGRLLDVPVFVVISAANTRGVCNALLGHVVATARNRNCGFVRVARLEPSNWPGSSEVSHGDDRGLLIPVQ